MNQTNMKRSNSHVMLNRSKNIEMFPPKSILQNTAENEYNFRSRGSTNKFIKKRCHFRGQFGTTNHFITNYPINHRKHTPENNVEENILKEHIIKLLLNEEVEEWARDPKLFIKFNSIYYFDSDTLLHATLIFKKAFYRVKYDFKTFLHYFFVANLVTFKYRQDYCVLNSKMTKILSIPVHQLNFIEAFILNRIDYRLEIPDFILQEIKSELILDINAFK